VFLLLVVFFIYFLSPFVKLRRHGGGLLEHDDSWAINHHSNPQAQGPKQTPKTTRSWYDPMCNGGTSKPQFVCLNFKVIINRWSEKDESKKWTRGPVGSCRMGMSMIYNWAHYVFFFKYSCLLPMKHQHRYGHRTRHRHRHVNTCNVQNIERSTGIVSVSNTGHGKELECPCFIAYY